MIFFRKFAKKVRNYEQFIPRYHFSSMARKQSSNKISSDALQRAVQPKTGKQSDFFERVWEVARQVPFGRVTTYGAIAEALGAKSSSRMVGWAMNAVDGAHRATDIPAHRVINRNGELSGKHHFATPTLMRELLEAEGVEFVGEAVNLAKHLWKPPVEE
jgi:methylated-DNA-protein-cysteine methyltransferase related protein